MTILAGQLSTGGAGDIFGATDLVQTARTAVATGTADTLKIVLTSSPGSSIILAVYADSAGAPAALLGNTASTAVIAGTNSLALVSGFAVTTSTVYHLAMLVAGATANLTDSTPGGYSGRTGVGALPDPFGSTAGFSQATNSLPMTIEGSTSSPIARPTYGPRRTAQLNGPFAFFEKRRNPAAPTDPITVTVKRLPATGVG